MKSYVVSIKLVTIKLTKTFRLLHSIYICHEANTAANWIAQFIRQHIASELFDCFVIILRYIFLDSTFVGCLLTLISYYTKLVACICWIKKNKEHSLFEIGFVSLWLDMLSRLGWIEWWGWINWKLFFALVRLQIPSNLINK